MSLHHRTATIGVLERFALAIPCHRMAERCIQIRGHPMPICARCLGLAMGHMLVVVLFLVTELVPVPVACALTLPLLVDWLLQRFAGIESTNYRRLLTGILAGVGIGSLYWTAVLCLARQFPAFSGGA